MRIHVSCALQRNSAFFHEIFSRKSTVLLQQFQPVGCDDEGRECVQTLSKLVFEIFGQVENLAQTLCLEAFVPGLN